MPTINISGAAARQQAFRTTTPRTCLNTAARAILGVLPPLRHAHTAFEEWENTSGKHRNALPPAPGYPGYWSGDDGSGDVCLYLGDGEWSAIDWNGSRRVDGAIGIETTGQRSTQVGGTYLGYSDEFLGYNLSHGTSIESVGSITAALAPSTPKDQLVELLSVKAIKAVKATKTSSAQPAVPAQHYWLDWSNHTVTNITGKKNAHGTVLSDSIAANGHKTITVSPQYIAFTLPLLGIKAI